MDTPRLHLRPWVDEDAASLYRFASDPLVGPPAGWPVHRSIEDSAAAIFGVLSARETYALVLRQDMTDPLTGEIFPAGTAVGSVGIKFKGFGSYPHMRHDEVEIGYWIGVPFWGRGLVPEAVRVLLGRCFDELGCVGVLCGYFDGNEKSRRVQEKCGFTPLYDMNIPPHPLSGATVEHFTYLSYEDWAQMQEPATHIMKLREGPYRAVASSQKTIELRLYDAKRQAVRPGDILQFTSLPTGESVRAEVQGLHVFRNFEELYAALIPKMGAEALGYTPGAIAAPEDMLDYYSEADIARFGVVGIEIKLMGEEEKIRV